MLLESGLGSGCLRGRHFAQAAAGYVCREGGNVCQGCEFPQITLNGGYGGLQPLLRMVVDVIVLVLVSHMRGCQRQAAGKEEDGQLHPRNGARCEEGAWASVVVDSLWT